MMPCPALLYPRKMNPVRYLRKVPQKPPPLFSIFPPDSPEPLVPCFSSQIFDAVQKKALLLLSRWEPFFLEPAVEEFQAGFWLVHWHHVAARIDAHVSKVAMGLDFANLAAILGPINTQVFHAGRGERLVAWPFKSFRPRLVPEPIADEIGISSIDQYRNLLQEGRHQSVEGLHPVTLEQEVAVDVKVARVVAVDLSTKRLHDLGLVEELANPTQLRVAQVATVLALAPHIVHVLAGALVGSEQRVIAVDGGGDAGPHTFAVIARLNERYAAGKGVIHRLARTGIENGWPSALTARHWTVVGVLGQAIGQPIPNQHGLQVDVSLLVRENFRGKDGDIVARIRFPCHKEW